MMVQPKDRKSYTQTEKAEIINAYFTLKTRDKNLSIGSYAKKVGMSKTIVFRWIQDKENVLKRASDDKFCLLKKRRGKLKKQPFDKSNRFLCHQCDQRFSINSKLKVHLLQGKFLPYSPRLKCLLPL